MSNEKSLDSRGQSANADDCKWLQRGFLLAIVLGCAVAMSPNPADPDLWGHVRYGRDVLTDGHVAPTTTYSFTADGYRWINHENFAEICLAIGADTVGPVGLVVAKCLLSIALILLIIRQAGRQNAHLVTVCVIALLVAVNMAFHWSVRPQLFTYGCFTLLILLLTWCFEGWQGRWTLPGFGFGNHEYETSEIDYSAQRMRCLWLAPILFLFWANSHGGFVAGYCVYSVYLICRAIEVLFRHGREGSGVVRRFALMIVVAGLATLINPYGPGLHLWLFESLGTPRPEITEWHAPELFTLGSIWLWLIIGFFVTSITLSRRPRDLTHTLLMCVVLWQSLEHQRHIPFFAILFGFWMPIHVESMFRRLRVLKDGAQFAAGMSPIMKRMVAGGLCLAFALLIGRLALRVSDLRVDKSNYPVAAAQFIADHEMTGKIVVTYNWAQYVIGAFGPTSEYDPGIEVSFDGRFRTCYPQEVVDMNFDFVIGPGGPDQRWRSPNSPPADSSLALEHASPDLVLISRRQKHSVHVMKQNEDKWVLLYQDSLAQLWGLRTKYDDPHSLAFIPPAERNVTDNVQQGFVTWPALPTRGRKNTQLAAN